MVVVFLIILKPIFSPSLYGRERHINRLSALESVEQHLGYLRLLKGGQYGEAAVLDGAASASGGRELVWLVGWVDIGTNQRLQFRTQPCSHLLHHVHAHVVQKWRVATFDRVHQLVA